jgi:hypothetical protein
LGQTLLERLLAQEELRHLRPQRQTIQQVVAVAVQGVVLTLGVGHIWAVGVAEQGEHLGQELVVRLLRVAGVAADVREVLALEAMAALLLKVELEDEAVLRVLVWLVLNPEAEAVEIITLLAEREVKVK